MTEELPLNLNKELMRWGPIPGYYFFISDFVGGIFDVFSKKYLGEFWSKTLGIFKEKKLIWINEFPSLRKQGQSVFLKFMLPIKMRKKVWAGWQKRLSALNKIEKEIDKTNLSSLSLRESIHLWEKLGKVLRYFWEDITIPELANYGSDKILEMELKKYIDNKTDLSQAMEILTAPERPSFYQQEELDLLKAKNIEAHVKKYFWLRNNYAGTEILGADFFKKRKKELPINFAEVLKNRKQEIKKRKNELQKKYKLPEAVMAIAAAIVKGIEWQDARKKDILIYLHYKILLLKETARRLNFRSQDLLNFGTDEILKMLKGRDYTRQIKDRRKGFAVIVGFDGIKIIGSRIAARYWKIYTEEKVSKNINEIFGIIASAGKGIASGRVRIVLEPTAAADFKKGDILVAPMTSPEYIFVMKKSAAVITDAGGLTSHAAIVSRELGIPCIVGTKIATKVLKDGDLVEVDANKGIVRIIK